MALGILKSCTRAAKTSLKKKLTRILTMICATAVYNLTEASQVVVELNKVLAFNHLLISFKNHPDIGRLARGVGPVSLVGGEYDSDKKMEDLKLLYSVYASSSGRTKDNKMVKDAIASGVDGYDAEAKKSVRKAAHGLRLMKETALSIASKAKGLTGKEIMDVHRGLAEQAFRQQAVVLLADGQLTLKWQLPLKQLHAKDKIRIG
ncbi:hypothetical protein OROGR_009165 [Orobanche gracilis]